MNRLLFFSRKIGRKSRLFIDNLGPIFTVWEEAAEFTRTLTFCWCFFLCVCGPQKWTVTWKWKWRRMGFSAWPLTLLRLAPPVPPCPPLSLIVIVFCLLVYLTSASCPICNQRGVVLRLRMLPLCTPPCCVQVTSCTYLPLILTFFPHPTLPRPLPRGTPTLLSIGRR